MIRKTRMSSQLRADRSPATEICTHSQDPCRSWPPRRRSLFRPEPKSGLSSLALILSGLPLRWLKTGRQITDQLTDSRNGEVERAK